MALGLFVRREVRRLTTPSWFDGAVAGLGAATVCAAFAFSGIEHAVGTSPLAVGVALAYPVGDVLLLMLVAAGSVVMSGRGRGPWLLLAAGIMANVLGDTANLFASALHSGPGVLLNALAWPISTFAMSLAMWLPVGPPNPFALRRPPSFLLPGIAAAASLGVVFVGTLAPISAVATGLGTATLLLVGVRTLRSVGQLRSMSRQRLWDSLTDHLTGLANRRRLFDALDAAFAEPEAQRDPIVFLFIDLDGFKRVNDAFGHPVGDRVLQEVAVRLERALAGSGLLARVGGDEFAVMVTDVGGDGAMRIAERLGAGLEEPFGIEAVSVQLSSSVGVAVAPSDAGDSAALVACADLAMYRAKLTGSGSARYDRSIDGGADRLTLADELSDAIDSGRLTLHYQPQLDLHRREVTAVEALVRWQHPTLGLIPPLTFLPLAEEAGLMPKVTRWVLDAALAQCAAWWTTGVTPRVSVNVAVGDLLDPGFAQLIAARLHAHRLPAAALQIEITETSIIEEFDRARTAVARVRELGVQVSIDDFGAGFTSLAYLNQLDVGELKLDRRFIAPLADGTRSRDSELVRAMVDLGHALGLQVVAEGVEDDAALELLGLLGCDVGQGYGIGRPVPAAQLELTPARREPPAASLTVVPAGSR